MTMLLSQEQELLKDSAAAFLAQEAPVAQQHACAMQRWNRALIRRCGSRWWRWDGPWRYLARIA